MSSDEPRVDALTVSEAERRAYASGHTEQARLLAEVHDHWRAAAEAQLELEDAYQHGWDDGHDVGAEAQ